MSSSPMAASTPPARARSPGAATRITLRSRKSSRWLGQRGAATESRERSRCLSRATPALTILVGDDRGDNDAALDDLLIVGVNVEEGEARSQNAEDDCADHGSCQAADAARERGPADHSRRDCVEL